MLIDWFTVGAQIINFLILVWLLRRFLYKPILTAMDEREETVEDNLKNAAIDKEKAANELLQFQAKNREFENMKIEMIKTVQDQAEEEHQALLEKARIQMQQKQTEWEQSLANDKDEFFAQLTNQIQEEVVTIARKVLSDLADVELEEQMVNVFLKQFSDPSITAKDEIVDFVRKAEKSIMIRSSFELSNEAKQKIEAALKKGLTPGVELGFEYSSDLMCGIELVANGKKASWNLANYLTKFQSSIQTILERNKIKNDAQK